MILANFKKNLDQTRSTVGMLFVLLLISGAANIGLISLTYSAIGRERTVIIPPEVHKSFWVDNAAVSKEYLEQMGTWILDLETSLTGHNIEWKHNQVLKYVIPGSYSKLKSYMDGIAVTYRRDNLATAFNVQTMNVEQDKLRVTFSGILTTFMGDRKIADNNKTYIIEFLYTGTKLYLKTFEEAAPDDATRTVTEARAVKAAATHPK